MKIHRFIDDFDLKQEELEIGGDIARQIKLVLKLEPGEKIELSDGKGISAIAEIIEIGKNKILVKINTPAPLRSTSYAGQNGTKVNLFCSILKKENFELVVQKTTECGVSSIVPIITSRTVKTGLNLERLKKIAREASEQSGRAIVPEITEGTPPYSFKQSLGLINKGDLNILFDSGGEPLGGLASKSENINIWIGPEGGWTPDEIKIAKENNFEIASLGQLTLRGETAAIIATYLLTHLK